MAMTAAVKDELSRLTVTKPCCRKAEVSATLRFAGGLHIVSGRIVVEAASGRIPEKVKSGRYSVNALLTMEPQFDTACADCRQRSSIQPLAEPASAVGLA